jgi:hypothetical protein
MGVSTNSPEKFKSLGPASRGDRSKAYSKTHDDGELLQ